VVVGGGDIMIDGCFGRMKLWHIVAMKVDCEEKLYLVLAVEYICIL